MMGWQDWSNRSINGQVCGMLGCEGKPTSKCPHCNHFYCYDHIKIHIATEPSKAKVKPN